MRFCLPASLGMVVPVTAQSEREPPTWGSSLLEDEDRGGSFVRVMVDFTDGGEVEERQKGMCVFGRI